MSLIKVPSWFELFKDKKASSSLNYWKEQAIRFGFDTREIDETQALDNAWQSFFYEKFFEYTLKKIEWNAKELPLWERFYWKRNGRAIEKLMLSSTTIQTEHFELLLSWLPGLKVLKFHQTNRLLQTKIAPFASALHTIHFHDLHLLSKEALSYIPKEIRTLHLETCRKISPEFFEELRNFTKIESLSIKNSGGIEPHFLRDLPKTLISLDLSNSGKGVDPASLELLPQGLQKLKLNGWQHCSDDELARLPAHLSSLEIDGWNITSKGLKFLGTLPLKECSLRNTARDDFGTAISFLPKSLIALDLSQNNLQSKDLLPIKEYGQLKKLELEGLVQVLETPLAFPRELETLNISNSSPFAKQTIQELKELTSLTTLKVSNCSIENDDIEWLPQNLTELDLSRSPLITDAGVSLLTALPTLKRVSFAGCEQIRGFGLCALSQDVKQLSLAGCHRLSGKSLPTLPLGLEELYLDSCELIESPDTQYLPTSLQVLQLSNCPSICDKAIDYLATLPLLHTIDLKGCPKVFAEGIQALIRRKFGGTIIKVHGIKNHEHDIELHPTISTLKKITNFKAKLINRLGRIV